MKTKTLLIGMVTLFTVVILVGSSYAKIDSNTIVGMWMLNEGQGDVAKDSSGNSHDGKLVGNPKWVDGKFGKALEFNGSNGVQITDADDLSLATFTIAAWIKVSNGGAWQQIVIKPERNYSVGISPGNLIECALTQGGNYHTALSKKTVTDGQWHHVAGTYDKKVMRVYVDGTLEDEKPYNLDPDTSTSPVEIGSGGGEGVTGIIDELYIFNVAITSDDTNELVSGVTAVKPADKLASAWGAVKVTY